MARQENWFFLDGKRTRHIDDWNLVSTRTSVPRPYFVLLGMSSWYIVNGHYGSEPIGCGSYVETISLLRDVTDRRKEA